jgi:hypothetical protein
MPAWQFDLTDRATEELADIWTASKQRSVVNAAMERIEHLLTNDPRTAGKQLSEGLWAINCPPLRALYEIDAARQKVNIQTIKNLSQ